MPNICEYTMKVVAKDAEAIERLLGIMRKKDSEYFIYRCFDVSTEFSKDKAVLGDGGFYEATLYGDVAWTTMYWFNDSEDEEKLIITGFEKKPDGHEDVDKPIYGTAHYAPLTVICKKLGIGVECWGQEPGNGFQNHYVVNHKGEIEIEDSEQYTDPVLVGWTEGDDQDHWIDENGDEKVAGVDYQTGFGSAYETFLTNNEIYGEEEE